MKNNEMLGYCRVGSGNELVFNVHFRSFLPEV